jgi:hypothetical protein
MRSAPRAGRWYARCNRAAAIATAVVAKPRTGEPTMYKKLAAFTLALSGLCAAATHAHAAVPIDGPLPVWPPIIKLPPPACTATLNEKKTLSWQKGSQSAAGKSWNAGIGAGVGLYADCTRLSAEASVGLTAQAYDASLKPLEVTLSASTKSDQTNSIDIVVRAFGHDLKRTTLAQSSTPIDGAHDLGYVLPDGTLDGQWTYAPSWADGGFATVQYNTVANVAADIIYYVGPTEVTVRTIAAGQLNSALVGSVNYHDNSLSTHATLNIGRFVQGGHAQLKQDAGATWKAHAGNSVSFTNVLGISLGFDIPVVGRKDLINLTPGDWGDDYSYEHTFTKPF